MKTQLLLAASMFLSTINCHSQAVYKLWQDGPPTSNEITEPETEGEAGRVSNVTDPEITVYLPTKEKNRQMAVVICPGGGYTRLAIDHEGHQFAKWLQSQGIAGIVLKYRLPNTHKEVPLDDAMQAMRMVREKSTEWDILENKIGIAGFSAGGHLASTLITHLGSSEAKAKANFSILFYPVINMGEYTHQGSRNNLLGKSPSAEDIMLYSNEKRVNASTPPTLLILSDDDKTVAPENSTLFYNALKKNNIPASLYIFPEGGHGWGMNTSFKYHNEMLLLLKSWLEDR